VTAQDAARHYGLTFDRKGWAVCPFHSDKHPSMSFRAGRFRCWACNASGDAIDFTGRLLGLKPTEAVRRLNEDFHLSLPLDRQQIPAERRQAQQEAARRQELTDTYRAFEEWRRGMVRQLDRVFRMAHLTLVHIETPEELEQLPPTWVEAILWQPWAEYTADILSTGTMAEQMEIFRDRKGVADRCNRILSNTLTKFGTA